MKTINNAKISILIDRDNTTISIYDRDANITIAKVTLTPQQLSSALSRMAYTDCSCAVGDLSRVGKKQECRNFEFEVTYSRDQKDLELACSEAMFKEGLHEWESDDYYKSQNTFFKRDRKEYAQTMIRRWV